jgi:DNA gyrase/topoisomerase IV subunit A
MSGIIASDLIKSNTREYGKYILRNQFPCLIDGLKRVQRRILYALLSDIDGEFSGNQLTGSTGKIHPYGDTSIYDAATRMCEPFRHVFPLLVIFGKGSSYEGETAAHARYTKFKYSDFFKDVFYAGINYKTIPTELTEDLMGKEIQYFIPKVPISLIFSNESVGFGYSSKTIPLKFENICDIVSDYVRAPLKEAWNFRKHVKLFLPCFPSQIFIKNEDDLITAYSEGKFEHPVETEGWYYLLSNNSVLIKTLAYGISPSAILSNILEAQRSKKHWLSDSEVLFETLSEGDGFVDWKFSVRRGSNVFELVDKLRPFLRLRSLQYVTNKFVLNDKLISLNPPGQIGLWYQERYRSIFSAKKLRQQELEMVKMRLKTYLIVCDHVDDVINIIRDVNSSEEDIYNNLKTRFDLSKRQCDILLNSNLNILMKSKSAELQERLKKVLNDIHEVNESFKLIDCEIENDMKSLKRKYRTPQSLVSRKTEYIGGFLIDELGLINVSSASEIHDTAKMFSNVRFKFIPYSSGITSIKFIKQKETFKSTFELSPIINTSGINIQYRGRRFIFTRNNGRSHCYQHTSPITIASGIINYVSQKPMTICADGSIKEATRDLFDNRKHCSDVLFAFDPVTDVTEYILMSTNAASPGTLRFQKITLNDKCLFSGAGETTVIGIVPIDTDSVICNLPDSHKNSIIIVDNPGSKLKGKLEDCSIRGYEKY